MPTSCILALGGALANIVEFQKIAEVVGDWYFERGAVVEIDCAYPCDSTCCNLIPIDKVCLEMLSFANYSGDADSKIVREVWARLLDQALTKGGVAEACSVVKRVGSKLDPADGACLPLDIICLHLEKAAVDRLSSGEELVGDDDVARALLGACKGLPGPVLVVYDHLLSNGAIIPSLNLKLRLLRSVLAILREWGISVIAHRLGTTSAGASFFLDGTFSLNQTGTANQGARDKIISLANRYMTEVRRLNLP